MDSIAHLQSSPVAESWCFFFSVTYSRQDKNNIFSHKNIIVSSKTPEAYVEAMLLDLASFASIRNFAEQFRQKKL